MIRQGVGESYVILQMGLDPWGWNNAVGSNPTLSGILCLHLIALDFPKDTDYAALSFSE